MFHRKYALLLAAVVTVQSAGAAEQPSVDTIVAKAASTYLADAQTRAVSIGVVYKGQRYAFHHGALDKGAARKPDNATIYPIASITKTFAGTLLAQAAIDGKLKLDDDVRNYLDGTYANLAYQGNPVRLYHLLNHRSGLPRDLPGEFYASLHGVVLTAAPGTKFQYSNSAAQLAGYTLERVYGRSFETLLKEKLTDPVGMGDTAIALSGAQQQRLAPGYDENGVLQPPMSNTFQAAGAIKSTLPDMLKYAQWHLEELDAAAKLTHKATYTNDDYAVGLNWQMLTAGGRRVIWQDGAIPGYASFCILQPEAGLALVILSNQLGPTTLGRLSTMANEIMTTIDARSVVKP